MNNNTKLPPLGFIWFDWIIQLVMLIIMIGCLFGGAIEFYVALIAIVMLMPFGLWQIISGIVGAVYGSVWRMKYLGVVLAYFLFIGIGAAVLDSFRNIPEFIEVMGGFIAVSVPLVLGIWYMIATFQDKKRLQQEKENKTTFRDMDDILDIAMLGED